MLNAIDCQSFAGGFTLGMQKAGFEIIAKREAAGGFGVPIVVDNMPIQDVETVDPARWTPRRADVVFGNPPCSGFSGLTGIANNTGSTSGADHSINQCMWDLVRYAALCKPDIVIMESVQLAYTKGRSLMQSLRAEMEEGTGKKYDLIHVLQNNASFGGASQRKRYFMVLSRRKFGIDKETFPAPPNLDDFLLDLRDVPLQLGEQALKTEMPITWAARALRDADLVDGHDIVNSALTRALVWLLENGAGWNAGEYVGTAMRRTLDAGIEPPDLCRLPNGELKKALLSTLPGYRPRRAYGDRPAGVINGTGTQDTIHPSLPRPLTLREGARIMGFPDSWSLKTMWTTRGGVSQNQKWLGKGISVPCGEWIGNWAISSLMGTPGEEGAKIGEREYLIDATNWWKDADPRTAYSSASKWRVAA